MSSPDSNDAVNGKIDMGTRKLKAAYVENATTIYAYLESDFHVLKEYMDRISEVYKNQPELSQDKIVEGEVCLIFSDKDKCAARARIEQPKAGPAGTKVRARLIDIGRGDLFDSAKLRSIPDEIKKLPTVCQRYKMADLKPKGRDEGFSAQDREKGAEWLRSMISKFGPVIKANCHQIVNYKGGIMFEGEIGGKNVNQLALMQGLAVPNPAIMGKQPVPFMIPGPGFGPRPPMRPMPHQMPHQEWDADYLEYGGVGRAPGGPPGMANNQRMPLRRPKNQGRLFAKDVDYEKIRTRTIKFLWRVLDSSKNGSCLLSKLQHKYLSLIGELIPHLKLGYKDLESFIRGIPDLVSIEEDGWGNKVVMIKDKIKMPNGNQVALPVPGGYNPMKASEKGAGNNPGNDMYKLKTTVQTLEASLSKKNKEIAELKKSRNEDDNSSQNLAEVVARVQALRLNQNPKDDQIIREKVADTARLVRDVHQSLTVLGKKASDADKAVAMLSQCQEQILTLEDAKPLEVTLDGAKQAVANYAGSYCQEFNELRNHLDDGCEVLQQVLVSDVPGPQVKLNVGQLEASKRKDIVDVAAQMADQWAKEDKKETARNKSDESLGNLINGLTETAAHLQGAANGQGLPQKSLPNVNQLAKKAMNSYNFELGILSPPGSAAAELVTPSGGMNYVSVMATLAKAITICLAEKAVTEDKFQKYTEVINNC